MGNSIQTTSNIIDRLPISHGTGQVDGSGIWAHDLIATQAAIAPAALAVRSGTQHLTFRELDRRANRLARHLQTLGVGAETPVGLYFERSADFIVAALAVLKSGGAYVPLDPAYPPARIDAILKDANVPVLLSHKWMAASLAGGPWKIVDLDFDASRIERHSPEAPETQVNGHDLAYLIYTSGSTGRPKGVEVTHANLLHLIRWHQHAFSVSPSDSASQIAGLAFDAAVWEMWCHLAVGASLHLIDEASRRAPETLQNWLLANKITIAFVSTILAEDLIAFEWPADAPLRFLLTGADTLHHRPRAGLPFVLVNNYGPTECTVLVTSGPVHSTRGNGQIPTIGRPVDDTEILIMNAQMQEAVIGDEGEICVAGPQVCRGYRNLPQLTAEKFLVSDKNGARRLYRTGDRGRILPDGEIAFLGRMDDQIKIRGFRIEPDEIVVQLNSYPGIRNSVVVARGDNASEKVLLAYLAVAARSKFTATQLREYLRSRLPDYMIPSAFVTLSSFPVTTTGKCDKQSLPDPSADNLLPDSVETGPANQAKQSDTETRIAQLVSGLMAGRPIERDDNFFLIGGHSMMAAQLIARVRDSFAVTLNLRQLFEAPTIAALASLVDGKLATK